MCIKVFLTSVFILFITQSFAANKTWLGGTSTAWNNAANWSGGTLPAHGDNITIAKSGAFDPNITTTAIAMTFRAGNLTIDPGNTLTLSFPIHATQHLIVEGSWTNNGTLSHSASGVVRFTGAAGGSRTIGGTSTSTFTTIAFVGATAIYSLTNDIVVNNLFNTTNGSLNTNAFHLSGTAALDMSSGGTLYIGTLSTIVPELTGTYTFSNTSEIDFSGAGNQTILGGVIYPNVAIYGSGTKTLAGDITIDYTLTAYQTCTLDVSPSNYNITFSGLTQSGGYGYYWAAYQPFVFMPRAGTVSFQGTMDMGGDYDPSFNNITITGSLTSGPGGADFSNMNVGGNWVNNGAFSHNSGTVTFNGTSTVSGTATTSFKNVVISGTLTGHSGTMNITGNWTNNGTYNHNTGLISFNGTSTVSGSSATTFYNIRIGGLSAADALTGHATSMNVSGNWINNAVYTHNNGMVIFTGSNLQTISGTASSSFYNIEINNTSTGVALSQNISVNNNITMTDGDMDIRDYNINMGTGTSGSIIGEAETNRIMATDGAGGDGLGTGTVYTTRDIGAPSALNVAGLGAMITSAVNMGSTTITRSHQVNNGSGSFATNESVYRSYTITPTTNTGLNATFRFYYWDAELNGHAEVELELYRFLSGAGYWEPRGATTTDAGNNYVELTGIDDFSKWSLGSSSIPLPIQLINFNAQYIDKLVYLNWSTASEINNDYFTIERMNEEKSILKITSITGAGNSQVKQNYQAIDESPLSGTSYYRLKQTDYDGKDTYSKWVLVNSIQAETNFALSIFPNPSHGDKFYINIDFADNTQKKLSVSLNNVNGKLLYSKNLIMDESHNCFKIIPEIFLSPGVYIMSIILEDKVYGKKIFVE